jgi:peptidoglycan/xylan/chitin deacetylase (PgdA/CDA1 family)
MANISFRVRLLILAITVVLMAALYHILIAGRSKSEVYVVLRYDDYANGSSDLVEKALLSMIRENKFNCSFGVIPFTPDTADKSILFPLDSEKINMIRQDVADGSIEICQHGYDHLSYSKVPPFSEFKGMPEKEQLEKITTAKKLLENSFQTQVGTFIPPWNSYDENTLKILSGLNVTNVSADQLQIVPDQSMKYAPFTALLPELKTLLAYKKVPTDLKNNAIVLLLHDYDFKEVKPETGITTVPEFLSLMKQVSQRNWKVISIRDAVKLGFFTPERYKLNRIKLNVLAHLKPLIKPGFLFNRLSAFNYIYLSKAQVMSLFLLALFYYYFIFLVFNEIFFYFVTGFITRTNLKYLFIAALGIVTIFLAILFWRDDHTYGTTEILVLVFMVSLLFTSFIKILQGRSVEKVKTSAL